MALTASHSLAKNVELLKGKANKYAVYGVIIASVAIIIATSLVSYYQIGGVTLAGIIQAQKTNGALWLLDVTPFFFAFWGQYVGQAMAYQAGALVHDLVHEQTSEMRAQTIALRQKADHDYTHDRLTDLPNRVLLCDRLEQALHVAHHEKTQLAILVMDLDRFKEINDTLGHYHGDHVLKQVAARLQATVQDTAATVARLGSDEFAMLLPKISSVTDAENFAGRIGKVLQTRFALEGLKLDVQASIGIAVFPTHGADADTLLQRADVAMSFAKDKKRGDYFVYDRKLDKHSPYRLTLMGELRNAIDADQLVLHYQPKVNIASRQVTEVEALVRWQHPERGLIGPDEFIERAEMTGLIKPVTKWVLNHALQQQASWKRAEGLDIGVAVNISAYDLLDVELPDRITAYLATHGVVPEKLILEMTESSIMRERERALQILTRLAEMGVRLSIDDFGTGYSSLSYLSELPVNEIKIDKSFVMDMTDNPKHAVIVEVTIAMAQKMGLGVIGEGTATERAFVELAKLGCEAAQGNFISQPISAQDFVRWTKESPWRPRLQPTAGESHAESVESAPSTVPHGKAERADTVPPTNEDPPEIPDTPVTTETAPATADNPSPIHKLDASRTDKHSIKSRIKELEEFVGQMDLQDDLSRPAKRRTRKRAGR